MVTDESPKILQDPPCHCTGKSAVMPTPASKRDMRANTARHALECANVKTSAWLEKGLRRGRDGTSLSPRWYSEHRPNVGRVFFLRKCLRFET